MYDVGLREAKINTYDIGTCEGMKQVALINEEARHKQINLLVCVRSNPFVKIHIEMLENLKAHLPKQNSE